MSDISEALAWVNTYIIQNAWNWVSLDLGGYNSIIFVIALALVGFVFEWIISRFKHVAHMRYDDYFDIAYDKVDNEFHHHLSAIETRSKIRDLHGFGKTFDSSVEFGDISGYGGQGIEYEIDYDDLEAL
jgi:hypothetical protein